MINRNDVLDALKILGAYAPDKTPNPDPAVVAAHLEYTSHYPSWTGDDWVTAAHELSKRPRERIAQAADLGEIVKANRRDAYERMDPNIRDTPYADLGNSSRALPPTHPLSSGRYVDPDGGYIDSSGVRRDRHGEVDKSAPKIEYEDGWGTEQRLDTYWRKVREQNPEYAGLAVRPATAQARDAAMRQIIKTLGKIPDDDGDVKPRINALLVACPFCKASKGQPCRTPGVGKMRRSPGHPSRITEAAIAAGCDPAEAERISDGIHAGVLRKYRADVPRANTPWAPKPVGCPDCGSLKRCEHDSLPPSEVLYRFDRSAPNFPDSDARDREYARQQATAGLE